VRPAARAGSLHRYSRRLRASTPPSRCQRANLPMIAISFLLTIYRFENAKSVITCAVFLASPLSSTFARMLAFRYSCLCTSAVARPSGIFAISLGRPQCAIARVLFAVQQIAHPLAVCRAPAARWCCVHDADGGCRSNNRRVLSPSQTHREAVESPRPDAAPKFQSRHRRH